MTLPLVATQNQSQQRTCIQQVAKHSICQSVNFTDKRKSQTDRFSNYPFFSTN